MLLLTMLGASLNKVKETRERPKSLMRPSPVHIETRGSIQRWLLLDVSTRHLTWWRLTEDAGLDTFLRAAGGRMQAVDIP